jgi:hypothetical protein
MRCATRVTHRTSCGDCDRLTRERLQIQAGIPGRDVPKAFVMSAELRSESAFALVVQNSVWRLPLSCGCSECYLVLLEPLVVRGVSMVGVS